MANITPVIEKNIDGNPNCIKVTWETLTNTNYAGSPLIGLTDYTVRSIQVIGTFGTGGSVSIQGSNDSGATFATLTTDNSGAIAATFTAAGIKRLSEITQQIKPVVTVSDGTTDLDVIMILVKR